MAVDRRLEVEAAKYEEFQTLWKRGAFEEQRLGQAFYNHLNLHKLTDQAALYEFYEADGEKALRMINELFLIR